MARVKQEHADHEVVVTSFDGFARFMDEQDWTPAERAEARRIAQLRMMRGLAPMTEKEWETWATE